jgi:putative PIN family toxin of toxin-antitoxin system
LSATKQERENALALISEAAQDIVHPTETPSGICRDKDDDNVLACAWEGAVDYLVTGDKDLLHLKVFKGIRIITPREFELLFDN